MRQEAFSYAEAILVCKGYVGSLPNDLLRQPPEQR